MIGSMRDPSVHAAHDHRALVLKAVLLALWAGVSFGVCFFARDLDTLVADWPFHYWMAAQGGVLAFILIVAVYCLAMNHIEPDEDPPDA